VVDAAFIASRADGYADVVGAQAFAIQADGHHRQQPERSR
jgi:hypothetical protein